MQQKSLYPRICRPVPFFGCSHVESKRLRDVCQSLDYNLKGVSLLFSRVRNTSNSRLPSRKSHSEENCSALVSTSLSLSRSHELTRHNFPNCFCKPSFSISLKRFYLRIAPLTRLKGYSCQPSSNRFELPRNTTGTFRASFVISRDTSFLFKHFTVGKSKCWPITSWL